MIAHEVVTAKALRGDGPGIMSDELLDLEPAGLKLVSRRLADALGTNTHSVEVEVENSDEGSVFGKMTGLLESSDRDFVSTSQSLARRLSEQQVVGSIKGGIAVVIEVTMGPDDLQQRAIIIVKAESDPAFIKQATGRRVTLHYVREMVFGPQQRLFKIGAFVELRRPQTGEEMDLRTPGDFSVIVYDHGMDIKDSGVPAKYFYSGFLGTTISPSAPLLNKRFYEATSEFINNSTRTREEKWLLRSSLISYLRSQEGTISTRVFGERFLPESERAAYRAVLSEAKVPNRAIQKDTKFIKDSLKIRRLVFSSRVSITAPADRFTDLVQQVREENDATILRIAGRIDHDE